MSKAMFSFALPHPHERDPHANADTRPPTRARRHAPADTRPPTRARRHAPADTRPPSQAASLARSLLLTALLCLTALGLGPAPARAGHYSVVATGGTWTDGGGNTHPDIQNGTQDGCDYGTVGYGVASAQGAVTVSGTWVPAPGKTLATDPPPQCLFVWEEGYAYYEANGHDFDGGTCDDGLGDVSVPTDADIAGLTSGVVPGVPWAIRHLHVHDGGPTFTWTRTPSITPGSGGGVCGDLLYSIWLQGFNFPPYVMLPNGTYYRLIALGSPDAGRLGAPGVATAVPYDPSDPFGPDGEGDPAGPLGMTSAHPGTMPGTPQNAVVGGMVQGMASTGVTVGVVLVTMGTGAVLEGVVDLSATADGVIEGEGGGGGGTGGGGGGTGGGTGGGNPVVINLGGEGEIPGAINQNGPWVLNPGWQSSNGSMTLQELQDQGNQFVISRSDSLPFAPGSIGVVYTNSVPVDMSAFQGPGYNSTDILGILKPGAHGLTRHLMVPQQSSCAESRGE